MPNTPEVAPEVISLDRKWHFNAFCSLLSAVCRLLGLMGRASSSKTQFELDSPQPADQKVPDVEPEET